MPRRLNQSVSMLAIFMVVVGTIASGLHFHGSSEEHADSVGHAVSGHAEPVAEHLCSDIHHDTAHLLIHRTCTHSVALPRCADSHHPCGESQKHPVQPPHDDDDCLVCRFLAQSTIGPILFEWTPSASCSQFSSESIERQFVQRVPRTIFSRGPPVA